MVKRSDQGSVYQIRIRERLDFSLSDWMEDLTIIPQTNGETLLTGQYVDQAALRGLMNQLWDRNFTILALEISGS
jgi:hypothetical protein